MPTKKVPELDLHGDSVQTAVAKFVYWYNEHLFAGKKLRGSPRFTIPLASSVRLCPSAPLLGCARD